MFGFFKSFFGGGAQTDAAMQEFQAAVTDGLDIEAAISAHQNWKLRLLAYLQGKSEENLKPEVICFDNRCDLGKWIHSTGQQRLGRFPGFTALMSHHRMFHYAASNVVALAQAGKADEARKMFAGQYENSSKAVIEDLEKLLQMVEKKR